MRLFKRYLSQTPASVTPESEALSSSLHHPELIDDSEYDTREGFIAMKRRMQRAEWRQRQAHYEKYGSAPAPSIIRPDQDWLIH